MKENTNSNTQHNIDLIYLLEKIIKSKYKQTNSRIFLKSVDILIIFNSHNNLTHHIHNETIAYISDFIDLILKPPSTINISK